MDSIFAVHGLNYNESLEDITSRDQTATNSSNTTDLENYKPYEERLETYVVPIIFAFVFVVGVIGNGTLILVFIRHKSMRTIPNTYIFSLSIGDLLVITGALPFVSTIYTFESWPYGAFVCKLSEFIRDTSVSVTVITLTALSVDRYIAIVFPLRRLVIQRKRQMSLVVVAIIWTFSLLFAYPGAHFSFLLEINVSDTKVIEVCYPFPDELGPIYPKMVVLTKFLILYVIPLTLITLFYVLIAMHLYGTSRDFEQSNKTQRNKIHARVKVTKLVLVLISMFAVCLLPNHIFMLWFYFYPNAEDSYGTFWHCWRIIGFTLSFFNSCLNPLALYFVSGAFRKLFQRYLFFCAYKKEARLNSNLFSDTMIDDHPSGRSNTSTRNGDTYCSKPPKILTHAFH